MLASRTTAWKAAANRRNAQQSTGPRTAVGKATASQNGIKHGLNTPVPLHIVRACEGQYGDLLSHVRATSATIEGSDLVCAVAAPARLRSHRAELMQIVVEAGLSEDAEDIAALRLALTQLGRLRLMSASRSPNWAGCWRMARRALAKRSHACCRVALKA